MKFYDRKSELETLERIRAQSEKSACFTVVTGRRRVGKSALLLESLKKQKYLYLFALRESESLLCARFQREAEATLGIKIFGLISRFGDLFEELLKFGKETPFTLVIDEFQELGRVNPALFGEIQDRWDRYKKTSKINFIVCGSVYSLMTKIFEHDKEPLFGRMTSRFALQPFSTTVIKKILSDHNKKYTSEDLLCLYTLSGGIPKYIELLMDSSSFTADKMIDSVCTMDSPFLYEGRELLIGEFGRDYGVYFSILQLIAAGKNSQSEIDSIIGKNTGAYLGNLERDYTLISRVKPLFARPESRNARWKIADQYLRFYFRFILPNQGLIETGKYSQLKNVIRRQYEQYSGFVLEDYFRKKLGEENAFTAIGNFWDKKGLNEIDIVAVDDDLKSALVAEVKRNSAKLNLNALRQKAAALDKELSRYEVEYRLLSMADM